MEKSEGFTARIEAVREVNFRFANRLTRLSGSLRFGASSWPVGPSAEIWATTFSSPGKCVRPPYEGHLSEFFRRDIEFETIVRFKRGAVSVNDRPLPTDVIAWGGFV